MADQPTTAVREQVAHLMHRTATGLPWPSGDRAADQAERDQYREGADAVLALLVDAGMVAAPTAGRRPRHLADLPGPTQLATEMEIKP